jgi:hypothetical protein
MYSFDGLEFLPDAAICDKFTKDTNKDTNSSEQTKVSDMFLPHNAILCDSPENTNPTKLEIKFKHRMYRKIQHIREEHTGE